MLLAAVLLLQAAHPPTRARAPWENDPLVWPGWEYLGRAMTGADWYIHNETIRQVPRGAEGWVRIDYTHDRTQRARMQRGLVTVYCRERRYYWRSLASLDANGGPVGQQNASSLEQDVPPDTMLEVVFRHLCPQP